MSPSHVLLTGVNGFIGSHILSQLLASGSHVRGIVRTAAKAAQVQADFSNYTSSQLDLFVVPDMTAPHAYDTAVQASPAFDVAIHTASPLNYAVAKTAADFIDPAIAGTLEILSSIKRHAPSIRRVVLTGSFAAIGDPHDLESRGRTFTGADWNPVSIEEALSNGGRDLRIGYWTSKTYAERAAWDFLDHEKPNFDLVVLNPPMVYGPLRHTVTSVADLNMSNARIYKSFINSEADAPLPSNGVHVDIDVRDLATAHLRAATVPEAGGGRFLLTRGSSVSSQEIADVLRGRFPAELGMRVPRGEPGCSSLSEDAFGADNGPARRILGMRFRGVEETFGDLVAQLLGLERGEGVRFIE